MADWVDVVELEARVQEVEERLRSGRVSSAFAVSQAALGLARGRLLPEDDAIWVDDARRSADRLVARARLLAAEAALAAGDASIARAAAAAVLDGDPYDEAALRLMLQADAAAGRPAAALAEYAVFRRRLVEELGVGPSPETERVHAATLGAVFYGFSVLYCLTSSLAAGGAGLGTCGFNESVARRLGAEAGFSRLDRIPLDNPFNNLYEAVP